MKNSSLETELKKGNICVQTTVGDSMFPMLRDRRDTVIIEPVKGRLKRYDLPLYRRPNGQYVLHRILKVKPEGYVICGDNRYVKEDSVPEEWILGVVTGFYRNNRFITVDDWRYRLYVHVWCDFFLMSVLLLKGTLFLKKVLYRIKKKR